MSRSKRLVGVADASPVVQFLAPALSTCCRRASLLYSSRWTRLSAKRTVIQCWQALFARLSCWLRPSRPCQQFLKTAVKVKLLLPPRQSRGNSFGR